MCKPDVMKLGKQYDQHPRKRAQISSSVGIKKNSQSSLFKTPSANKLDAINVESEDDDDDFLQPKTRAGKLLAARRKDPAVCTQNITTTKRPRKKPGKWCVRVPILKPGKFTHTETARILKSFILSCHGNQNLKDKIICRFIHGEDPDGDVLETTFTCGELATVFGEFGEIDGELMGYIMSHWKIDNTYNHVYGNATRVLLSPYFMTYVLEMDGSISSSKFDVKRATARNYVSAQDNLARACLILILYCKLFPITKQAHYVLYAMNNYRATFDVLDSYPWARRIVLLMKELYTQKLYDKLGHPNWQAVAKNPNYVKVPTQSLNQCGFYCLKFASDFDGEKLVDNIEDSDPRVDDWKAEYLFSAVFTHRTKSLKTSCQTRSGPCPLVFLHCLPKEKMFVGF